MKCCHSKNNCKHNKQVSMMHKNPLSRTPDVGLQRIYLTLRNKKRSLL